MGNRLALQNTLSEILGNTNVYYQPPEGYKLKYPCIIYNQEPGDVKKANNKVYSYTKKYSITCIYNADNENIILKMLNKFEYCSVENTFVSDNLYHYIFTLYY
jgi:hypothetical protein